MTTSRATVVAAVILVGLSAGFFYTYEASVTVGLSEVDDVTYVTTFQSINATIRNFWFAVIFFGPLPVLAMAMVANRRDRVALALLGAALSLYVAGAAITFAGNVPLNDELATFNDLTPAIAAGARAQFEDSWNRLNLWRTLAVVASFITTIAALVLAEERTPVAEP